jgi:hypothetical protein
MTKAQKAIDPVDFTSIPRTKDFIDCLPDEVRVCSEHGESVGIRESDMSLNPGPGAPFGKADFVACCDAAIDKVIDAIRQHNLRR